MWLGSVTECLIFAQLLSNYMLIDVFSADEQFLAFCCQRGVSRSLATLLLEVCEINNPTYWLIGEVYKATYMIRWDSREMEEGGWICDW